MGPRRRRIGRWGLAIAVTLIVHGAILLPWLLLEGPPAPPPTPPVELALLHPEQPPLEAQTVTPRSARAASSAPTPASAQETPSTALAAQAEPSPQPATTPATGAPSTAQAAAGPPGPPALNLACFGNLKRLATDQRRQCEDKQWAGIGKRDPSDSGRVPDALIDPAKAAYYQAVLDAKHSAGHGPGFGCGMAMSLGEGGSKMTRLVKKKRLAKEGEPPPPHSLKLGPLPCYITPPQGFMTPEADVQPMEAFKNGPALSAPGYIKPMFRGTE